MLCSTWNPWLKRRGTGRGTILIPVTISSIGSFPSELLFRGLSFPPRCPQQCPPLFVRVCQAWYLGLPCTECQKEAQTRTDIQDCSITSRVLLGSGYRGFLGSHFFSGTGSDLQMRSHLISGCYCSHFTLKVHCTDFPCLPFKKGNLIVGLINQHQGLIFW